MPIAKVILSGLADGLMNKIAATATPGDLIHTAAAAGTEDELWIWAQNNHTADLLLTLEWGGVASPDDLIQFTVPFKAGLYLIVPGLLLTNAKVLRAFAATTNLISIAGYVNRHT